MPISSLLAHPILAQDDIPQAAIIILIAIPIVLVLWLLSLGIRRLNRPRVSGNHVDQGQKLNCPHCDEPISPNASVCPHCRRAVYANKNTVKIFLVVAVVVPIISLVVWYVMYSV